MPDFLRSTKVRRIALVVYVLCLSGLIFAYFVVSAMEVPTSAYVQSSSEWVAGHPNALRGMIMNAQNGRTYTRVHEMELALVREGQDPIKLSEPEVGPGGIIHMQVRPPRQTPLGTYDVRLRVWLEASSPAFEARSPVEILPPLQATKPLALPERTERMNEAEAERTRLGVLSSDGPVHIDIVPRQPVLARGLPNTVYLRTTERETGQPIPCSVRFDAIEGLFEGDPPPAQIQTNTQGIGRVALTPTTTHHWKVSTACSPPASEGAASEASDGKNSPAASVVIGDTSPRSKARIQLGTAATQMAFHMKHAQTGPDETAKGVLRTIFEDGGGFVDLWRNGRWVWASSFGFRGGRGGIHLDIPEAPSTQPELLYRAQVFQDIWVQGRAWDAQYLWGAAQGDEQGTKAAIERLAKLHHTALRDVRGEDGRVPEGVSERLAYFEWLRAHPGHLRELSEEQANDLLRAMLREIPEHYTRPPVLINSQDRDQRELDARKDAIRAQLYWMTVLMMCIGVAALALVVMWGLQHARHKQRLLEEVEQELIVQGEDAADIDEATVAREGKLARAMAVVQGAVVLGTLLIFIFGVLMIMKFMM